MEIQYPKPTDSLDGYEHIDNYGGREIWKKGTQRALVDVLQDGSRSIHLNYAILNETPQIKQILSAKNDK